MRTSDTIDVIPVGLSTAEAESRLTREGPNTIPRAKPRTGWARILGQLTDPLVALLLAAAVITIVVGDWTDTAVIVLVVVLNTAIGVSQQVRADRAIAALDHMTAANARVIRDGRDTVVPVERLVCGDLVRVEAGDVVPADLRLDEAHRCQADEAALTGESVPAGKRVGDELHSGTVVTTGRALGTVIRTGAGSALGRIAALVAHEAPGPTPLQRRIAGLGRVLGAAVVVLCALVFAVGVLSGRSVLTMGLVAVSLVVAAVPESLPAVVTLSLALGARRMARHHAVPRHLHAVEALGSVTVLASDKTGTLTEGKMSVRRVVVGGVDFDVDGVGYEPVGRIEPPATPALTGLARAALLCSDASLVAPDAQRPQWTAAGDPMEAALVAFAMRCGLDVSDIRAAAPRVAEQPFDQDNRRMTTIHQVGDVYLTVCKGAPESVLAEPLVDMTDPAAQHSLEAAKALAALGLRVLAVAIGHSSRLADPAQASGLHALGVIAVGDPLRPDVPALVRSFTDAGVQLKLITGDHPHTATAIAAQAGILHEHGRVAAGHEAGLADEAAVFARTRPEQKLDIIAALQAKGHVVAMTGDGVNDAPALRRADIGVAMGGGTEVARQAADLVLLDDNLVTITTAIGEGRRVYDNLRRFLRYALAGGLAEIIVMLLGPVLGMPIPLLPGQILWVNLLTHGLPGVALGAEPAEPDVLHRPPRQPGEQVLGAGLGRSVLWLGSLVAAAALAAGLYGLRVGAAWQSMVFVTLGLAQLGLALASRARREPGRRWSNPGLLAAVGLSVLAQVAAVWLGPLRELLGTQPLSGSQWLICLCIAAVPASAYGAVRLATRVARRRPGRSG